MKSMQQSSAGNVSPIESTKEIEKIKNSMESTKNLINSEVDSAEFLRSVEDLKESGIEQVRLLELTDGLKDQGKLKSAIRILEELVPAEKQSAAIAVKLGEYCLLDGNPEVAIELYEKAVLKTPAIRDTFWFQKNIGESYFYANQPNKSQSHFRLALGLCGDSFDKYNSLLKYFISFSAVGEFFDSVNGSYCDREDIDIGSISVPATDSSGHEKNILIVDSCVPRYDQDAGSVLMQGFLRSLVSSGYSVWFFSGQPDSEKKYISRLLELGVRYLDNDYFQNLDEMIRIVAPEIDVFMLTRVETGGRYFEAVRRANLEKPIIFNTVDLHFVRTQRHYEAEGNMGTLLEAKRLKRRESYLIRNADATIVISNAEQKILDSQSILGNIWQLPIIVDFPEIRPDFSGRENIAFIGSYNHLPNIDAVDYFCQEIWPEIYQKFPDEKLIIVGPSVPQRWHQQYHGINNVEIAGFVPDLEEFLGQIKCTVVPLRVGAGQKGKIATSLAHGVPCISTPVGVEGMSLTDGVDVAVCHNTDEWVQHLASTTRNESYWGTMSSQGYTHAFEHYSEERVGKKLVEKTDELLLTSEYSTKITA